MENVRYFSRGIWVSDTRLHCPELEVDIAKIRGIHSDLRVDLAVLALLGFMASLLIFGYLYFVYSSLWFVCLVLLVGSFAWLRHVLFHYVELYVVMEDGHHKVMVVGMEQRNAAFEVEDYLKSRLAI